jgi:hypothetical protein
VHDDHVPLARVLQDRAHARPVDRRPGLLIDVDPLAGDAGVDERLDLSVEVLLGGRHARVSQLHERERTGGRGHTAKAASPFGTNLRDALARVLLAIAPEPGRAFHFQGCGTPG